MSKHHVGMETLEIRRLFTDVSLAFISKLKDFYQFTDGAPVPVALANGGAYDFTAEIQSNSAGDLTSASVSGPNAINDSLTANGGTDLKLDAGYNLQSGLDAAFPNGNYDLHVNTVHDGSHTFILDLAGNTYPNTPDITNFDALQGIDASKPQTVHWNAFAGGTTSDVILLQVRDANNNLVYSTPASLTQSGVLNGTATFATIPAGTLLTGQDYNANVIFVSPVAYDSSDYSGVIAFAVYGASDYFTFSTLGASYDAGAMVIQGGAGNDSIGVTISNGNYVVTTDSIPAQDFLVGGITSIEAVGLAGADTIVVDSSVTLPVSLHGAGGNDCLSGGSGNDMIKGGSGNDTELGNAGNDTCIGGIGSDSLVGGAGADELLGGADNDTLLGGGGPDTLAAGIGDNSLSGGAGDDSLIANNGTADTLDGGAGFNSGLFDAGIDSILNVQSGA